MSRRIPKPKVCVVIEGPPEIFKQTLGGLGAVGTRSKRCFSRSAKDGKGNMVNPETRAERFKKSVEETLITGYGLNVTVSIKKE